MSEQKSRELASNLEVSNLKRRLKTLSKNDLIRLVVILGNDIGYLKAQNLELDKLIQEGKLNEEKA